MRSLFNLSYRAAALSTDEDVVAALVSIYEASGELSVLFGEVAALRDRIDRLLAQDDDGDTP